MTTVVWRDRVLAADSMISSHQAIREPCSFVKIQRLKEKKGLLGNVGIVSHFNAVKAALEGRRSLPSWGNGDAAAILIKPDATVWQYDGEGDWYELEGAYFAWGSGAAVAYGALAMGASAAEAVEIASEFDLYTGGRIVEIEL